MLVSGIKTNWVYVLDRAIKWERHGALRHLTRMVPGHWSKEYDWKLPKFLDSDDQDLAVEVIRHKAEAHSDKQDLEAYKYLKYAVIHGNIELTRSFLALGIPASEVMFTISDRRLLQNRAKGNLRYENVLTNFASRSRFDDETFRMLLDNTTVRTRYRSRRSSLNWPFSEAIRFGKREIVEELWARGPDTECGVTPHNGHSTIHAALHVAIDYSD
jgi:hypothetical protein